MFSPIIINKLQAKRREAFATYDSITLRADAVRILARLFMNPDCQTDIDLFSTAKKDTPLSYLGEHIITAAPSALARFAGEHHLQTLTTDDMLLCYAVDHAHLVEENHIPETWGPRYALAHILNISRVDSLVSVDGRTTAELSTKTPWGTILFSHVVVPPDLVISAGQHVYHHYGVVITLVNDVPLSQKLYDAQKTDDTIALFFRTSAQKKLTIDFADKKLFHIDVLGQILKPQKVQQIKNPGDILHGRVKFKK
ncbi:MAG: hypothetical protein HY422_02255 [Candidatus Komeilibacteria bacterium]|nr:hypothetical protein [Candidatus Komeilibacteria bacterium]